MLTTEEKTQLVPSTCPGLSVNEAGEVSIVLQPQSGHIFVVNTIAKRIIELCDGQRTVGEIVEILFQEFDAPKTRIIEDLDRFFTKASEKGVVSWNHD